MTDTVSQEAAVQELPAKGHKRIERNVTLLAVGAFLTVAIGGIVEIAPLFWIDNTIEKVDGMRPYTPLEQAGRDIYVREGCYTCHSQMIRPFRDEVERYGHYSLAAESMYDHPFQWGSKRTGPDLARVGDRYSDEWHVQHLKNPQSVVPESIMPSYSFLSETPIKFEDPAARLTALRRVGVPYTDADIENAEQDLQIQANPDLSAGDFHERYPKTQIRDFDGNPQQITEMDALVAYLQMLGTLVDVNSAAAQEELASEAGR
ncbi:cytochrome-c oxidase, cbb3-type subunit II [Pontixanthobacter aestiaquae]|uniref:Cytochrome-c oxidase, cbb3-type subunit II n=1 Tax=Pontixanthobacter aestiaquae TaxID=1509367 RepID=A0A844Z354_9SPHN|nr:cytochrome-c oxidase, cbb3-type subunit II [Pontixanthobacter aestiaquae]MDN3647252.1 cytochrome-c oxidase, cbb3-type subunit II [Pontixanthobacter aestiaquae]MXO81772.1 cytochrome-c oxidase, cbb3-type subunit II [Pontixanthobacter aestiaquae]